MGCPPDERLPEVVPARDPQVLTPTEAWLHNDQLEERDPKYFVAYDDAPMQVNPDDAPKILTDDGFGTGDTPIMSALSPTGTIPWEHRSAVDNLQAGNPSTPPVEEKLSDERRICGMRRKMFFLGLGALFIIVAASIGGGVAGGAAAARNSAGANSSPSPAGAADNPSGTSSTTSSASPTVTNLNDTTPKRFYSFQGWRDENYGGPSTIIYDRDGYHDLEFEITSYIWAPVPMTPMPSCCITFCTNRTHAGGYRCDEIWRPVASGKFGRIWTGCGDDVRQQHKCSLEDPDGSDA